jgi:hypothetical protein
MIITQRQSQLDKSKMWDVFRFLMCCWQSLPSPCTPGNRSLSPVVTNKWLPSLDIYVKQFRTDRAVQYRNNKVQLYNIYIICILHQCCRHIVPFSTLNQRCKFLYEGRKWRLWWLKEAWVKLKLIDINQQYPWF